MIQVLGGRRKYKFIQNNVLLSVIYKTRLFSWNSEFQFEDNHYQISKDNFWATRFSILKNGSQFGEIKIRFSSETLITYQYSVGINRSYRIKKRRFWKNDYFIIDESNTQIADIQSSFNWRTFKFDFTIRKRCNQIEDTDMILLSMLSVKAIDILINQEAGAGAAIS